MAVLDDLKRELEQHIKIAESIKENIQHLKNQIEGLNNRGKEVSYHCTYLQGKIDALEEGGA